MPSLSEKKYRDTMTMKEKGFSEDWNPTRTFQQTL